MIIKKMNRQKSVNTKISINRKKNWIFYAVVVFDAFGTQQGDILSNTDELVLLVQVM